MERKSGRKIILPPLNAAGPSGGNTSRNGGRDKGSHSATSKRVKIAGVKEKRTEPRIPTTHVNIGEVVHPFKNAGVVDGVYSDTSKTNSEESISAALLPQDLYSCLIKKLPGQGAEARRKSMLSVPQPQSLMKHAIFPRQKVDNLPVYKIPSSTDLILEVKERTTLLPIRRNKATSSRDDLLRDLDRLNSSESSIVSREESIKSGSVDQEYFRNSVEVNEDQSLPGLDVNTQSLAVSDSLIRRPCAVAKESRFTSRELREKFRSAIKMVILVVGLNNSLKNLQTKKGDAQSIEQLNYYSTEAEFAVDNLVFKKAQFAASNIMFVPGWARYMMGQRPEDRSSKDITRLASMLKSLRYFKNDLQFEKLEDLCRHATFALYEKQRTIMRTGHTPLFAYLLMSGSVFVNIEMKSQDNKDKKFVRTACVLQRGSLFGEIAVIHNIKRTASIVSRENVECLVIDTDTCMRIFPEAINRDFENRLHHLKKSGLFDNWPHDALKELCLVSKKVDHTYGDVIEKSTASSEFIYMVVEGRVEIMYLVKFITSDKHPEDRNPSDGHVTSISKLISKPPNHVFLPPLPFPSASLLRPTSHALSKPGVKVAHMSMGSLEVYDCCDMLSLVKGTEPLSLVLVSRGSEVIRIPKLRLQSIPPSNYWKALLEKAKTYPRYPSSDVLLQIYLEHCQWSSYRKLVYQNHLSGSSSYSRIPRWTGKGSLPQLSRSSRGLRKSAGPSSGTTTKGPPQMGSTSKPTSSTVAKGKSEGKKKISGLKRKQQKCS